MRQWEQNTKVRERGGMGNVGCFSLHSNKVITADNGGVISTNSKETSKLLQRLRFSSSTQMIILFIIWWGITWS